MERYEYGQWMEYTAYKGSFLRGEPIFVCFFTTALSDELLESNTLITALNQVGFEGWQDYRIDVEQGDASKRAGMSIERTKEFQKRYGFMPGAVQLDATRWFRRVVP